MTVLFNDDANRLSVTARDGKLLLVAEARNSATRPGQFFRHGPCPRGTFRLGKPVRTVLKAFGPWFIPVTDLPGVTGPMARFKRAGIGIHGGGSGLRNPLALLQGWVNTHGCIRVQNAVCHQIAALVQTAQSNGEPVHLQVRGKAS